MSPTSDSRRAALTRELVAAVRRRDRLLARATWWDEWRGALMLPLLGAGLGAGYLAALGLRALWAQLPERSDAVGAVVGLFVMGRWVTRFFDVRKLAMAERRVAELGQRLAALDDAGDEA